MDHVSGGRIEAGLGLDPGYPGYAMIGADNWENRERVARFGEYDHVVDLLLRTASCSFDGDYFTVERAVVHESLQDPRPPVTIAAMGPRMMRHAAAQADTWNTMSFGTGAETLLADAADLKDRMAAACDSEDRDPATLRHSFLLFDAEARERGGRLFYWDSATAFEDLAGRLLELGYDEIGVYYPVDEQRDALEEVATDVLPRLRR